MPDDVAEEKVKALLALGADVERVRPASIVDKKQFVVSLLIRLILGYNKLNFNTQNLARERAAHFGQDAIASSSAILRETSSVVVTTTAAEVIAPDHGVITAQDQNELKSRPRGFFADQFEESA
jgi:cysteine synthase